MHRLPGYYVVDRPIGYALTAAGEGVALAVQRRAGQAGRAAAPLGRSRDALPSQKQGTPAQPKTAVPRGSATQAVEAPGESPTVAGTTDKARACTAPAECECRECKAERCARCRMLLQELSKTVHAFSTENGPFVRAYAHLTYQQVHEGKKRLESLGKVVRVAQERFREHTRDNH